MKQTYYCDSLKKTQKLAREIAKKLNGGEVLILNGDLGAGKTTFTKALALFLGVKSEVTSPTFNIMREYDGRLKLIHIDMYRLADDEYVMLGLEDFLGRVGIVTAIEWNKVDISESIKTITIDFKYIDESTRKITVGGME